MKNLIVIILFYIFIYNHLYSQELNFKEYSSEKFKYSGYALLDTLILTNCDTEYINDCDTILPFYFIKKDLAERIDNYLIDSINSLNIDDLYKYIRVYNGGIYKQNIYIRIEFYKKNEFRKYKNNFLFFNKKNRKKRIIILKLNLKSNSLQVVRYIFNKQKIKSNY